VFATSIILLGCKNEYTPKPRGYFRIDFPEKDYTLTPDFLPYRFEYPKYAALVKQNKNNEEKYWIDIAYPKQKAIIHFSYKAIDNNLATYLSDSRNFAYKHTIKADAISESRFENHGKKTFGILYEIQGDAASNLQFFLTDSTTHFIRGALYFNVAPNKDSLAPVIDFIEQDIVHIMETFEWN